MEQISFRNTEITGGLFRVKQDMVRDMTVHAVYDRFREIVEEVIDDVIANRDDIG